MREVVSWNPTDCTVNVYRVTDENAPPAIELVREVAQVPVLATHPIAERHVILSALAAQHATAHGLDLVRPAEDAAPASA